LNEFKRFLGESLRIVKAGGKNVIAAPSLEKVARALYFADGVQASVLREKYKDTDTEPGFFPSRHINNLTYLRRGA